MQQAFWSATRVARALRAKKVGALELDAPRTLV